MRGYIFPPKTFQPGGRGGGGGREGFGLTLITFEGLSLLAWSRESGGVTFPAVTGICREKLLHFELE